MNESQHIDLVKAAAELALIRVERALLLEYDRKLEAMLDELARTREALAVAHRKEMR